MTEKLPKETKQFTGTLRPSRELEDLDAGARLDDIPEPPGNLSAAAAEHWRELAPLLVDLEILTAADLPALKLACKTLATVDALEASIEAEGFTIPAATGGFKAHPALKALETQRNAAARLLSDFGLNPKAKKFVSKAPGPRAANPYAKYRKAGEKKRDRHYNYFAHLDDPPPPPTRNELKRYLETKKKYRAVSNSYYDEALKKLPPGWPDEESPEPDQSPEKGKTP